MGVVKAQRYCPEDDRMVLAEKQTPNHLLHLLLTILTAGIWGIIWLLMSLNTAANPYQCPICGEPTDRRPPRGWTRHREYEDEEY